MTSDPSGRILSVSQSEDWHKKEKIFFFLLFSKDFRTEESTKALFYSGDFIRLNNIIDSFTSLKTTNLPFFRETEFVHLFFIEF